MRRIAVSTSLALALVTLGAVSVAAAGPSTNPTSGQVELSCSDGTRVIWVNFVASDLSAGGTPAIVIDGDGRVFKVSSASAGGETIYTKLPSQLPFEPITCTHDSEYGLVTLTGVIIP
jgi:hypothetical protein